MTAEPTTADVREVRGTKSRRTWRQFSLRTLLLTMLVLSVCLALFAWRLQRARRQAAAVATIRKLGGTVDYDYRRDPVTMRPRAKADSPVPKWLLKWLGVDFFHEVTHSTMNSRQPESAAEVQAYWSAISQLPRIEYLQTEGKWVDGRTATDALRHHRDLRVLWLVYGNLRGTDLEPLSGLAKLETIYLDHNPIGDVGAKHLTHFPKLRYLTLKYTEVGDDSISSVATNLNLEALRLDFTEVSDRGIAGLAPLTRLRVLGLSGTQVSDKGLNHLAKLEQIDFLVLMRTNISDQGLAAR